MTAIFAEDWQLIPPPREPVVKALAVAMADPETDLLVVNALAYALATAGEDGLTELLPLLSHDDFSVRAYAAEGLGSLDNTARWAAPALMRALDASSDGWEAYTIIRALGHIGGSAASTLLETLAQRERQKTTSDRHLLEALEHALAAIRSQSM